MLDWINKQDGVDVVSAEDINNIANGLIETQKELQTLVGDIETLLGGI